MIHPEDLDVNVQINPDEVIMVTDKSNVTGTFPAARIITLQGTCTSNAAESTKIVQLQNYTGLFNGSSNPQLPQEFYVSVSFTKANSYGDTTRATPTYPSIQFKNKNGVNIGTVRAICDSRGHYAGTGCYKAGDEMLFM